MMVLGFRVKHRRTVVQSRLNYVIHVNEIKPWSPSRHKRSYRTILLQCENGVHNSGSCASDVADGKIKFHTSFRLPVVMSKQTSKNRTSETFQKNLLEFHLYELHNDKVGKKHLLGSAIVNLADYGIIRETLAISTPLQFKKSSKSSVSPMLYLIIEPDDIGSASSSSKGSLSKQISPEDDDNKSNVSRSEFNSVTVNNDEAEFASFTDDEDDDNKSNVSSTMSKSITSSFDATGESLPQSHKNASKLHNVGGGSKNKERLDSSPGEVASSGRYVEKLHTEISSESDTSKDDSGKAWQQEKDVAEDVTSVSDYETIMKAKGKKEYHEPEREEHALMVKEHSIIDEIGSFVENYSYFEGHDPDGRQERDVSEKVTSDPNYGSMKPKGENEHNQLGQGNHTLKCNAHYTGDLGTFAKNGPYCLPSLKNDSPYSHDPNKLQENFVAEKVTSVTDCGTTKATWKKEHHEPGQEEHTLVANVEPVDDLGHFVENDTFCLHNLRNGSPFSHDPDGKQMLVLKDNEVKPRKSDELSFEYDKWNDSLSYNLSQDQAEGCNSLKDNQNNWVTYCLPVIESHELSDNKLELKYTTEMLQEELRETAAIEVSLYSVVADHGGSASKVHAPARRLSRFYFHACKLDSSTARACAARSAVSGLILVSKSCGNDVPRLTFWLSNSIMLRAILSHHFGSEKLAAPPCMNGNSNEESSVNMSSQKSLEKTCCEREKENNVAYNHHDWEELQAFLTTLQKVEAWIFSRIVESVWWQTLTPYMQSTATNRSTSRKNNGRKYGLDNQDQGSFSIDLWMKAFRCVCERLCPVRAGGLDCGCLLLMSRLVMEHLVSRLDVAMFNAILRESDEEMPTDPVSDPITDSKVLPIPVGNLSFGAGAQLKNAVGDWSRWLSNLFGIDDADTPSDNNELDDNKNPKNDTSFRPFLLLNALSDLLMLPFDVLGERSTRKEVCPVLGLPLIMRVANNFVPDEFCPNPMPDAVLEALRSEELEDDESCITNIPCHAAPTSYSPPSMASVMQIHGELGNHASLRSGTSVLHKSYTSDDELDQLDSPLAAIGVDDYLHPKGKGVRKAFRYELLREVWKDEE